MQCPYCNTINRDDQESCYHCGKDLSILRLIVNKARHHYNLALEHAERDRLHEAKTELHNALDLDRSHVKSWLALGTVYQRLGDFDNAQNCWNKALEIEPDFANIHDYLDKSQKFRKAIPVIKRLRLVSFVMIVLLFLMALGALNTMLNWRKQRNWHARIMTANEAILAQKYNDALNEVESILAQSPPKDIEEAAVIIRNSVHRQIQFYFDQVDRLISQDRYGDALQIIAQIQRLNPNAEDVNKSQYLRRQVIRPQIVNRIEDGFQREASEWRELEVMAQLIREYQNHFTDDGQSQSWWQQLNDLAIRKIHSDINGAMDDFEESLDFNRLAFQLDVIEKQTGKIAELNEETSSLVRNARLHAIESSFQVVDDLLEINRFDEARQLMNDLMARNTLSQFIQPSDSGEYERRIRDQQIQVYFNILATAVKQSDWPTVETTTKQLAQSELSEIEQNRLDALNKEATQVRGESYLQWFASQLLTLQNGRLIKQSEAELAVERWKFLEANREVVTGKWAAFQDDLLYCAARVYESMGNVTAANELDARLTDQFPDSPYADLLNIEPAG